MNVEIGPIIKETIEIKNLSQKQAAELLHISPQALSMYVHNRRTPDLKFVISMIHVFEIDLKMLSHLSKFLPLKSKDILLTYGISRLSDEEKDLLFAYLAAMDKTFMKNLK